MTERTDAHLSEADFARLKRRGISKDQVERQIELLTQPAPTLNLNRPCRIGDGILQIPDSSLPDLARRWQEASQRGGMVKFVPASGAATRMFAELLQTREDARTLTQSTLRERSQNGDPAANTTLRFLENLAQFPFYPALQSQVRLRGNTVEDLTSEDRIRELLDAVLGSEGLNLANRSKGLIEFHRYPDGSRTALEEHLVEASGFAADREGLSRLHFTATPLQIEAFRKSLADIQPRLKQKRQIQFEIGLSSQNDASSSVVIDDEGRAVRHANGELLLRPGGHGALLENLNRIDAEIVFIKNIDNVLPEQRQKPTLLWKQLLAGYLLELRDDSHRLLVQLNDGPLTDDVLIDGLRFVEEKLSVRSHPLLAQQSPGGQRDYLTERLDRPLRVCGMVPNAGQPGGGPFWVDDGSGSLSLQIVEGAQVDRSNPGQQDVWGSSTHFNPVDLVCSFTDPAGRRYDLSRFVDPATVFIARKTHAGHRIRAVEQPGLWNGAMARWNTVFVEVPAETFAPVKVITDLLAPEHQP